MIRTITVTELQNNTSSVNIKPLSRHSLCAGVFHVLGLSHLKVNEMLPIQLY